MLFDEDILVALEKTANKPEKAGQKTLTKSQSVDLIDSSIDLLLSQEPEMDYIEEMIEVVGNNV